MKLNNGCKVVKHGLFEPTFSLRSRGYQELLIAEKIVHFLLSYDSVFTSIMRAGIMNGAK